MSATGTPRSGLVAYGAYLPRHRLPRAAISGLLGGAAGRGSRSVAGYDEDTTTLGVEAARTALRSAPAGVVPQSLYFATAAPAYLDKTNATAIHAALGLPSDGLAVDMAGSVRSGLGAIKAALDAPEPTLAVLADVRTGRPGGADERDGGDGAAAFLFAAPSVAPPLAEVVATGWATAEIMDRWRIPGEPASRQWEERFGEHAYGPLVAAALGDALKAAAVIPDAIDHLVVTGVHTRAARAARSAAGVRPEALVDDLAGAVGNTGTAHPGLLLADVLDRAGPGQLIALVVVADGAAVILLRTTDGLAAARPATPVAAMVAAARDVDYGTFLTWRGFLDREPPRRPDPEPPAGPPSRRSESWKFAFVASRCELCGTRHLPPARVCVSCRAVDRMTNERLAETPGTIATFAIDRLAYSPSPPVVAVVVDFDGGGRYRCQLTEADPGAVAIGDRVEMTFRRLHTSRGIHDYFWKARPVLRATGGEAV